MARLSQTSSVVASILVSLALFAISACSSDDESTSADNQGGTGQTGASDDDDSTDARAGGDNSLAPTGGRTTQVITPTAGTPSDDGAGGTHGLSNPATSSGAGGTEATPDPSGWAGADRIPITSNKALDCGGTGCECNNGVDDDGDGQIDGFDVECIGPYDNDEGTFATGIPGDNSDPKWQDCFFDGNSGAGDDGCRYSTQCLTGELEPNDPDCTVTRACIDFCAPRTPNGCDCFGCCGVTDSKGVVHFVYVTGACSDETLDDPKVCVECTPSEQCTNECGECELCPGMEPEDLPASCSRPPDEGAGGTSGTPGAAGAGGASEPPEIIYTCDNGMPVCALDVPCAEGQFCMNGCCMWMAL